MASTGKLVRLNTNQASQEEVSFTQLLDTRIIGQPSGKAAAARAVRRARNRLRNKRGPIYKLLTIGKSRTGKTLTAEMAAYALHGDAEAMIKIECENYKQPHQIQQLLGAPPSYVGYKDPAKQSGEIDHSAKFAQANLTASRKGSKCPVTVVLLDEIEKASDELLDVLLGIFDTGKITLGNNTQVDFTDCIFFMTSNLGMEKVEKLGQQLGFGTAETKVTERDIEKVVRVELKRRFKPEFLKRLNEVVIYGPLTDEQLRQVVDLEVDLLKQRVFEELEPAQRFGLDVQPSAREFVLRKALAEDGGVAEIKHVLDQLISDVLGNELGKGTINGGSTVIVSHESGADVLAFDVDTGTGVAVSSSTGLQTRSTEAVARQTLDSSRALAIRSGEDGIRRPLDVLRKVSWLAVQRTLGERSYIVERLIHSHFERLAEGLGKQQSGTTYLELLEQFFEPAAVRLIMAKTGNNHWLWTIIQVAAAEATECPISVVDVDKALWSIRKAEGTLSSYPDYKTNNVRQAELVARGLLLIGPDKERGGKALFVNKLFQ